MAENDVDVLLSVTLDASETLKQIASLRANVADLKGQQKELDTATEEGRYEYARLGAEIIDEYFRGSFRQRTRG